MSNEWIKVSRCEWKLFVGDTAVYVWRAFSKKTWFFRLHFKEGSVMIEGESGTRADARAAALAAYEKWTH